MRYIKNYNKFSESIIYHLDNKLSISESIYRLESDAWLNLVIETRNLYQNGDIELSDDDKWFVESNIGEYGLFENEKVLLDIPFIDLTEAVKDCLENGIDDPIKIKENIDLDDIGIEYINDTIKQINEAEYKGKKVNLNKPFRTPGEAKKFAVYTKNDQGNVVKVRFGDPGLKVKNNDPERAKSFRARHNCDNPGPKWKARYWSCNIARYRKLLGLKSNRPW